MIALIMAGGSGTRFWPLSRKSKPKQFLKIKGEKSMLRMTVDRLGALIPMNKIYIVTALSQVSLVKEHLPELPSENIIVEPFGMNTAPCIGLSLAYLYHRHTCEGGYLSNNDDKNESIIVLPADHVIRDTEQFVESLKLAEKPASEGNLVTFGIVPDYPATGYGYIEAGTEMDNGIYSVKRFKEKPDIETAKGFLKQGNFFWNSGMFFWNFKTIWAAYEQYLPEVVTILEEIMLIWKHQNLQTSIVEPYSRMPKKPIDIGIMEKAEKRVVIPVNYGWSDVGSWKALSDISDKDENGNFIPVKNITINAKNNYVVADKFVSLIGVENLCVIETDDAILITAKDCSEEVKMVVESLTQNKQDDLL